MKFWKGLTQNLKGTNIEFYKKEIRFGTNLAQKNKNKKTVLSVELKKKKKKGVIL